MDEPIPTSVEVTDYDSAARFGARLNGVDFLKLISQSEFPLAFERWIDTRSGSTPEARYISDLIGAYRDLSQGGVPWCLIYEFKSAPDPDSPEQLLSYRVQLRNERPDRNRGSRYSFLSFVVNLTGDRAFPEPRTLGTTGFASEAPPRVVNFATFDALEVFARIDRGELGLTVLPFTVLMKHGDEPEMIQLWLGYLARELNPRNRGHFQAIARTLAYCCGRYQLWEPHLKENEMKLSPVALDWISKGREEGRDEGLKEGRKEGLKEGRQEGELMGQIRLLERLLALPISSKESLITFSVDQLQRRLAELESQWQTKSDGSNH
jgi:hypothetical protein